MSIVDRFLPKEKEPEYLLLLKIGVEKIVAIIWEVKNEKVIIIGRGEASFAEEDIIDATDQAITSAEKKLPEGKLVEKVIFGLPFDYIQSEAIKPPLLTKLKELTKALGLTPLGFIEIPQALSSYLSKKEDSPVSALLVGINKKTISVSFLRVGKIFETKTTVRTEHVITDIEKTLKEFTHADVLPSRILLYDDEESLEVISEELMKYPWHTKSSSFLHIPKIGILKTDDIIDSLISAASGEITKHFDKETKPEVEEESTESPAVSEQPKSKAAKDDTEGAESMGFVMDVDVAEKVDKEETAPAEPEVEPETEEEKKSSLAFLAKLPSFGFPAIAGRKKWIVIVVIAFIIIVGGGVYAFWQVPKATVTLIVGAQTMGKDLEITVDPEASNVDTEKLIIPGRLIEVPVNSEKTMETTGEKNVGSPAKGKVTVFNKTTSKNSLSKGTVLIADNLRFSIDSEIEIASASDTGEGLTFGKIETNATAQVIGPNGNISKDTQFTLADYSSTEFSARAEGNFSGGTSRQVSAVSKEDRDKLLSILTKELTSQSESELRTQLQSDELLLDNSLEVDVTSENFDKDVGDEGSELTLKLSGDLTGIAYKKDDLNAISKAYLAENVPTGYNFSPDRARLSARNIEINDDGTVKVSANLRTSLLPDVSLDEIRRQISGKTIEEVQEYLAGRDQIVGVELNIDTPFPFEKEKLPRNVENIKITIAAQ
ncbi:hypothetical protein HYW54_03675 [Candidatus Gottesmanbacteria bacterium]|nr:hypothetical protein [Candidatus Gottesmanbacteria bacterium]